jgi:hypothetical protein
LLLLLLLGDDRTCGVWPTGGILCCIACGLTGSMGRSIVLRCCRCCICFFLAVLGSRSVGILLLLSLFFYFASLRRYIGGGHGNLTIWHLI